MKGERSMLQGENDRVHGEKNVLEGQKRGFQRMGKKDSWWRKVSGVEKREGEKHLVQG